MKKPRWNRQKKCQWCGEEFTAKRKEQMFCSIACGHSHTMRYSWTRRSIKEKKRCANEDCEKLFTPKRKEQKFCSLSCSVSQTNRYRAYKRRWFHAEWKKNKDGEWEFS
jgi:hypothetical protein